MRRKLLEYRFNDDVKVIVSVGDDDEYIVEYVDSADWIWSQEMIGKLA